MASWPTPGQTSPWAAQLIECLEVEHAADGTHKNILRGTGSPEGTVAGTVGQLYQRINGGTGTTLYIKESGSSTTGWVAVSSGGGSSTLPGFVNINDHGATQGAGDSTAEVTVAQAALVGGGGGDLYFPPGVTYVDLVALAIPSNVNWKGAGKGVSIVHWNTDQGVGTKALICGGDNVASPSFSDMTLEGPGTVPGVGVKPCNMSGIQFGSKNWMRNVIVRNWHSGVIVNSDHNLFDNCLFTNCWWGNEYPESGWDAKGDQSYWYCDFTGCNLAGIHVAGSQILDHVEIRHTHFGFGPFGIVREDYANGTAADSGFMINVTIDGGAFEYMGNGAIVDLSSAATPAGIPSWYNSTIENAGWTENVTFRTSVNDLHGNPYPHDYAIDLPGGCQGGYIRNNYYGFDKPTGGIGVYNLGGFIKVEDGQTDNMFNDSQMLWTRRQGGDYCTFFAVGTVTNGDIVELRTDGGVQRASGIFGTKAVIGVALTDSSVNQVVLVAVNPPPGGTYVHNGDAIATAGIPLAQKTGAYHQVAPASSYPANPVIGYSITADGSEFAGYVRSYLRLVPSAPAAAQTTYTATNVTTDRAFDADAGPGAADLAALKVVVGELADVTGTLIADLRARGVVL